ARALAPGRVLTAFDPPELYGDLLAYEAVRGGVVALGATIVVPVQLGTELVGALTAGPKRSNAFYTAGDADFLRALAHAAAPLRRRLTQAAAAAPPHVAPILTEADDLVGIIGRGAQRTAAIVKDLRSFSRLDEATRKPVDLHDGLDVSLRLLEHRWRDRIDL